MKKFLLTLLLLGACAVSNAQSDSGNPVKSAIFNYLHDNCGYETTYDEDGDIQFTMDDLTYYAIVKRSDKVSFVEFRIAFKAEKPLDELLRIANQFNSSHYLCKCTAETGRFQISMEFVATTSFMALIQTKQALHWFPVWIDALNDEF